MRFVKDVYRDFLLFWREDVDEPSKWALGITLTVGVVIVWWLAGV